MGQQRSAEQGREGGRQGAGGEEERAPGGAEEEVESPDAGGLATQLQNAVRGRDTEAALALIGSNSRGAMQALQSTGSDAAFYQLLRNGGPYSTADRRALDGLYRRAGSVEAKKQIFAARFKVRIGADAGASFTESEMDLLHEQAAALPPGHVEGVAGFKVLHRNNAMGGGTHNSRTDTVKMGGGSGARFQRTFRHEIGHALDDSIGAVAGLRTGQARWGEMSVNQFLQGAGLGNIPAPLQAAFSAAFKQYSSEKSGLGPKASFEAYLRPHLARSGGDAEAKLKQIKALSGTNFALDVATQSYGGGGGAHTDYRNFKVGGDKAYFINHYYGKVFTVGTETHNHMKSWGNPAAAFSGKEWFAEVYAEWYSKEAGKSRLSKSMPSYVQTFMKQNIENYRESAVVSHNELSAEGGAETDGGADSGGGGWG